MGVASLLDQALKAQNIPIVGVRIGKTADRATWVVQYDAAATAQQRTTGQTIVNTIDVSQPAQDDADANAIIDEKVLKAIALGLWENWPNPLMTKVQLRNRILAIYKTL